MRPSHLEKITSVGSQDTCWTKLILFIVQPAWLETKIPRNRLHRSQTHLDEFFDRYA